MPRSWVLNLVLLGFGLLVGLAAPLAAQTGSITLHSVDLEFEGQTHTFLPGGDNVIKIPARPPFVRRRGTFSPKATFNAAAGPTLKRVVAACILSTDVDQSGGAWIFDEGPWDLNPAGPVSAFSFTEVSMTPRPFQIGGEATAAPDVTYTIKCELQRLESASNFVPFAESEEIVFRHTFGTDFTIDHIEVVQVVQDAANTVPLVAGKSTTARVFAKRSTPGSSTPVPLRLFLSRPGLPERFVDNDGTFPRIVDRPDRANIRHSHNLFIPAEYLSEGELTLRAVVNPDDTEDETNAGNNELTIKVQLRKTRGLVVRYIPVCIQVPGLLKICPTDTVTGFGDTANKLFPLSDTGFSYEALDGGELVWPEVPDTEEKRQSLFLYLERLFNWTVSEARGLIEYDQLAAWLPSRTLGSVGGQAAPLWGDGQGRVTINGDAPQNNSFGKYMLAHELGHNLGLRHTKNDPCGAVDSDSDWPYPGDSTTHEHGLDIRGDRFKNGTREADVMSYCQPASRIWMSAFHYKKLFDGNFVPTTTLVTASAEKRRAASSGEFAYFSGLLSRDGTHGELDPIQRFTGTAEESVSDPAGDYCLRFSAGGEAMGEHCFSVTFRSAESGARLDRKSFSLLAAWPAGATRAALFRLGQELDFVAASGNAPSVQFLSPAAGEQWEGAGARNITWSGNDGDGDPLLYALSYSHDDGQSWSPLVVDLSDTQFSLNPTLIQGGPQVWFRVVSTDGFLTGEATAGPINVVQQPQIAVDSQPVQVGEAVVGQAVEGPLVITNSGNGPLKVASVTSNSNRFAVVAPAGPFKVPAGGRREVTVRYSPGAASADAGTLTISSNATGQPALAVAVEGTGTDGQTPRIRLADDMVRFERVPAGGNSTAPVLIENRSLVDLEVQWEFTGGDALSVKSAEASFTIAGGETASVGVTFAPVAIGTSEGTLTIRSNDPDRAEISVPVVGNAIEPPTPTKSPAFSAASMVSAADFSGDRFAAEMWVALFGENLADELIIPTGGLPTSLGGTSARVRDSQGIWRAAKLQFVSPERINFLMPAGTATGLAVVEVTNADGEAAEAAIQVSTVAPGLFSANSNGEGPAAATWLRVAADGTRTEGFTFSTDAAAGGRTNVPIDISADGEQVFVSFFGTGFRFHSSSSLRIGGVEAPVVGAVAQGQFDGLDQAVAGPLPRDLIGRGEVDAVFTFDGVPANVVTISIH